MFKKTIKKSALDGLGWCRVILFFIVYLKKTLAGSCSLHFCGQVFYQFKQCLKELHLTVTVVGCMDVKVSNSVLSLGLVVSVSTSWSQSCRCWGLGLIPCGLGILVTSYNILTMKPSHARLTDKLQSAVTLKNGKMVNGSRYYRAPESVSIASELSTALTIDPCQIRVHQRWQS